MTREEKVRLDRMEAKIDQITDRQLQQAEAIAGQVSLCTESRKQYARVQAEVQGNGKESYDHRLTALETTRTVTWRMLVGLGTVAGGVAALAQFIVLAVRG